MSETRPASAPTLGCLPLTCSGCGWGSLWGTSLQTPYTPAHTHRSQPLIGFSVPGYVVTRWAAGRRLLPGGDSGSPLRAPRPPGRAHGVPASVDLSPLPLQGRGASGAQLRLSSLPAPGRTDRPSPSPALRARGTCFPGSPPSAPWVFGESGGAPTPHRGGCLSVGRLGHPRHGRPAGKPSRFTGRVPGAVVLAVSSHLALEVSFLTS